MYAMPHQFFSDIRDYFVFFLFLNLNFRFSQMMFLKSYNSVFISHFGYITVCKTVLHFSTIIVITDHVKYSSSLNY